MLSSERVLRCLFDKGVVATTPRSPQLQASEVWCVSCSTANLMADVGRGVLFILLVSLIYGVPIIGILIALLSTKRGTKFTRSVAYGAGISLAVALVLSAKGIALGLFFPEDLLLPVAWFWLAIRANRAARTSGPSAH